MATRAVVCLPTYDERENIEPMVRALGEVLDTTRDRVLVIDDASPDGTGEIADRLASELPWLDVLHRTAKEGLGRAYLAGFERALEWDAQLVLEMDCDFSHDPADVARLIAACEDVADLRSAPAGSRVGHRQLESVAPRHLAGGRSTRGSCWASRSATSPAASSASAGRCSRPSTSTRSRARLRLPDRGHVPGVAPASVSSSSRSPSSTGGSASRR